MVTFVFIGNGNGPLRSEIDSRATIVELQKRGPLSALGVFVRYLKSNRPDVVLASLTPANVLAIAGKFFSGGTTKIIINMQIATSVHEGVHWLKAFARPILYRALFPRANIVVVCSNGVGEDMRSCGVPASKIVRIYNPVVSEQTHSLAQEPIAHPWVISHDVPILVSVGRLHPQKDFPTLLRAIRLVLRKIPVRLIVLGEGSERKSLEILSRELELDKNVDFIGFVQNPYAFMKNADLFVLASTYEGFGNVIAESLSVGTPVVVTDCPWGPAEILENGRYGTLVPVGDSEALAHAIEGALIKEQDPSILMNRAKEFSVEKIIKEYRALIEV